MNEDPHRGKIDSVERIAYLIAGYVQQTLSQKEHDELDAWVEEKDENMKLFEELTDEENIEANMAWMKSVMTEDKLEKTKAKISFAKPRRRFITKKWYYGMAASALLLISVAAIYQLIQKNHSVIHQFTADVLPGGNNASLILENGDILNLNKLQSGVIVEKQGVRIKKTEEGEIVYELLDGKTNAGEIKNTLTTPRGGQYRLQLPDGSKVWLNAASSLRYPLHFAATERVVELTGEAYFDIREDAEKPFKVKLQDDNEVRVLGTEFNISAYPDETAKLITLVEGNVLVSRGAENISLQPGQQAHSDVRSLRLIPGIDMEEVVGWKEGEFIFRDADIKTIMKHLGRWYDVEVKYETDVSESHQFNASISRDVPVSRILQILEKTDKIHFKIENKTIYVLP